MSAVASAARERSFALRVSAEVVAPLALGVLFVALAVLTRRTWGDVGQDTGYDLVAATRVAHGAMPYRDFTYFYGPLGPYLLAVPALIGSGIAGALAFGLVVTAGIVGATYVLGRSIAGLTGGLFAAALVAAVAFMPTNFSFVLPHTESATLGTLLLLLAVLALRGERPLVGGLLLGLCAFTRLEVEAAALSGLVAWLVVRRPIPRDALRVVLSALAFPVCVYGGLAVALGPHRLFLENLYPVQTLRAAGDAVVKVHAPLTASSIVTLVEHAALYGGGVALLLLAARRFGSRVPAFAAIGASVAIGAGAALIRPGSFQYWSGYAYLWVPLGAAAAFLWAMRRRDAGAAVEAAMLAALAGATYAAFQLQAARPQPAVYAAPFAALLLVRLHVRSSRPFGAAWLALLAAGAVVVTVHVAHAKSAQVRGPGGSLAVLPADQAAYQGAVDWIDSHTRPGDPVLLAPQLTSLYTLADRPDPVSQISLLPGALPRRADELAAIRTLTRADVRVAVIDRHAYTEYGHTVFGGSFDTTLAAWIHRNFIHVAVVGGTGGRTLDIWKRRAR